MELKTEMMESSLAVDITMRLGLCAFARTHNPEEIEKVFDAMVQPLLPSYPKEVQQKITQKYKQAALGLSELYREGEEKC